MTAAKNIVRHSIVYFDGKLWMIETNHKPKGTALLIPQFGNTGKEIKSDTLLQVIKYPAQLATEFLSKGYLHDELVETLKVVDKYFIDLQNKCALTHPDEKAWKLTAAMLHKINNEIPLPF